MSYGLAGRPLYDSFTWLHPPCFPNKPSLYRTPRIRHVFSIKDDLEKERIPLGTKLLLRENGIKRFTSIVDSELRNAIAHLKFDIEEDDVFVKRKPAHAIFIISWTELNMALVTAEKLLNQLAKERGFSKGE